MMTITAWSSWSKYCSRYSATSRNSVSSSCLRPTKRDEQSSGAGRRKSRNSSTSRSVLCRKSATATTSARWAAKSSQPLETPNLPRRVGPALPSQKPLLSRDMPGKKKLSMNGPIYPDWHYRRTRYRLVVPRPAAGRHSEPAPHESHERPRSPSGRRSEFREGRFQLLRQAQRRRLGHRASAHVGPDQRRVDRIMG